MQYINIRTILALLLSMGLGSAVLAQGGDAMAEGSYDKQAEKIDDSTESATDKAVDDSKSAEMGSKDESKSDEMRSSEELAKDFKEWTKSEKPDDNVDGYASNGLTKLDEAIGSVIEDVNAQPMGGGPAGDESSDKEATHEMDKSALKDLKSEQERLSKIASDISGDAKSEHRSKQFHEAATATSQIFSSLQQAHFPKLEKDVKKLQERVDKIDASKPLASQEKDVEKFFKESSKVLDKMSDELKKDAIGGGPVEDDMSHEGDKSSDEKVDEVTPEIE
ncbi:hypothetical protein [Bradymonas sediminis]|uniref:Uncharacterized protein n=1 Tax=Bradymonas sediminis TaxID=1548548 RepID=A0A2Z4FJ90_9DELT|nr:hypothetical protein [Bradymonas sediminis]AWV89087.1 hypothetical protein DN745_06955 [Bradymonas sediminis]TDP64449.1 hypothetical protein DFR33_109110 [Bradymonas sediminis]